MKTQRSACAEASAGRRDERREGTLRSLRIIRTIAVPWRAGVPGASGPRDAGREVKIGHNRLNWLRGSVWLMVAGPFFYFFPDFSGLFRSQGRFTERS